MKTPSHKCPPSAARTRMVSAVRRQMPDPVTVARLAEVFGILGDPTRVRILRALMLAEMCVCDVEELLGASQSAVSHQLRLLRTARLVRFRKQGKRVFYALDDDHVGDLMRMALEHVEE